MIYEIKLDSEKEVEETIPVSLIIDEDALYLNEGFSLLSLRNGDGSVQTFIVKNNDLKILSNALDEKNYNL